MRQSKAPRGYKSWLRQDSQMQGGDHGRWRRQVCDSCRRMDAHIGTGWRIARRKEDVQASSRSARRTSSIGKQGPYMFYCTCLNLKTAVGGEVFLTQRSRDAENAEKIENLWFYRSDLNNLLFHPLGDVLLQRTLMHSSSYSQNSRHSLRSQPLCGSA